MALSLMQAGSDGRFNWNFEINTGLLAVISQDIYPF
jgi:hypothetical protein